MFSYFFSFNRWNDISKTLQCTFFILRKSFIVFNYINPEIGQAAYRQHVSNLGSENMHTIHKSCICVNVLVGHDNIFGK